jgi:Arc/MetJ-type ribon-helix-helix transcriptional regulator
MSKSRKKFEVKVNVSLPAELAEWLENQVRAGTFASFSHGIRRCVALVRTYLPEIELKIKEAEEEKKA